VSESNSIINCSGEFLVTESYVIIIQPSGCIAIFYHAVSAIDSRVVLTAHDRIRARGVETKSGTTRYRPCSVAR
jgi:hypothetical protein